MTSHGAEHNTQLLDPTRRDIQVLTNWQHNCVQSLSNTWTQLHVADDNPCSYSLVVQRYIRQLLSHCCQDALESRILRVPPRLSSHLLQQAIDPLLVMQGLRPDGPTHEVA